MLATKSHSKKVDPPMLSPQSSVGSTLFSILGHVLLAGAVLLAIDVLERRQPQVELVSMDSIDLGYESYEEPPIPEIKPAPKPIVKTPAKEHSEVQAAPVKNLETVNTELQDQESEVTGTQSAPVAAPAKAPSSGQVAATPYYKIKPKYPRSALVSGLEGWVQMLIDIDETGQVENVRVVDGEQRNTFQAEARRAVSKWKYRPFLDDKGHAIKKLDHQVRVDFSLRNDFVADSSSN